MGRLAKFFKLPGRDRWLLVRALLLVALVRLGLWVLPFNRVQRLTERLRKRGTRRVPISTDRIIWAVRTSSRSIPGASCLTQALATEVMLSRQGTPSQIRIGVAKNEDGKLEAHAWVESRGEVLIGGLPDLARYTPLTGANQGDAVARAFEHSKTHIGR